MEIDGFVDRGEEEFQSLLLAPSTKKRRCSISESGFFHLRLIGDSLNSVHKLIFLRSDRVYTIGRKKRHCEIVLNDRSISRRHCQIFLDSSDRKLRVIDGLLFSRCSDLGDIRQRFRSGCEGLESRKSTVSLNGVFINGRRLGRGEVAELSVSDEILFSCRNRLGFGCRVRYGFVVESLVFSEFKGSSVDCEASVQKAVSVSKKSVRLAERHEDIVNRAALLLSRCRNILCHDDPVSFLRSSAHSDCGKGSGLQEEQFHANDALEVTPFKNSDRVDGGNAENGICSPLNQRNCPSNSRKDVGVGCYSDGKKFVLNRLEFMGHGVPDHQSGVTLPELLHPVESLVRVFIATFTSDISWFLSYCQLPNELPITIACHNVERCWSSCRDSRTSAPYSNYPNLLLVYPPFPEVIAFGKDRKNRGVACHHPKLIVLQRENGIRVVVTSANLNSKQWNHVTNTVWWQDFPRRNTPDYSALFCTIEDSKPDFAAQLAGFVASLISDIPSQAHWIRELTNYDFGGAVGHLVASIPGIHVQKTCFPGTDRHLLSAKRIMHSGCTTVKFLGSVQASVVGLSHRFHTATGSASAQVKALASILGRRQHDASGTLEVLLKRNFNIPADANAMSILVADLDEFSEGDSVQLGFLPRDVAKWVSPLSDIGYFSFSAFIYPKETLAAVVGGSNSKVPLLLIVSQGPKFSEISRLIQHEHISPLCSLLASMERCVGLWRLQEVLSKHKWPESLETDFMYGSSSIGTSVNPQFLARFSAAAGKRSYQFSESDESDPEWGCWNREHELRNPSLAILFPTIERVKNGIYGVQPSRRLLSLSEKTWQRLRNVGIFHDAIPCPGDRVGYPMHVKVAWRRFQLKKESGSRSFGWIYCGSHNFSPAAWGQIILPPSEANISDQRLHICNYELGVVLIVPPSNVSEEAEANISDLDDIVLPFVLPAPKYKGSDRPATAQAMREALTEAAVLRREISLAVPANEEMDEDIPDEEEEMVETSGYSTEEKEEERIYAEMLWSQVDTSES